MNKNCIAVTLLAFFMLACGVRRDRIHMIASDSLSNRTAMLHEVIFTNPKKARVKKSDTRILDSLLHYIGHTPKGAKIFVNIYLLDYLPVIHAIEDAYKRGVDIKVIIDQGKQESVAINTASERLLRHIFKDKSRFVVVKSDVDNEAIDHEKYVLFSKVILPQGTVNDLVFATSHNFTYEDAKKAQDAIIITNSDLYSSFLNNWSEIYSKRNGGMVNFNYSVNHIGDSISAYFFPRRREGKWDGQNTIIEELDRLDKGTLDRDTVRVLMAGWSGASGKAIAKKLVELCREGAVVEVITRDLASPEVKIELQKLTEKGGYLKIIDSSSQGLHSKTMLIKGIIDGKLSEIILTGSHNYSTYALKYNNEFILKLSNSPLFDKYWKNWNLIKQEF